MVDNNVTQSGRTAYTYENDNANSPSGTSNSVDDSGQHLQNLNEAHDHSSARVTANSFDPISGNSLTNRASLVETANQRGSRPAGHSNDTDESIRPRTAPLRADMRPRAPARRDGIRRAVREPNTTNRNITARNTGAPRQPGRRAGITPHSRPVEQRTGGQVTDKNAEINFTPGYFERTEPAKTGPSNPNPLEGIYVPENENSEPKGLRKPKRTNAFRPGFGFPAEQMASSRPTRGLERNNVGARHLPTGNLKSFQQGNTHFVNHLLANSKFMGAINSGNSDDVKLVSNIGALQNIMSDLSLTQKFQETLGRNLSNFLLAKADAVKERAFDQLASSFGTIIETIPDRKQTLHTATLRSAGEAISHFNPIIDRHYYPYASRGGQKVGPNDDSIRQFAQLESLKTSLIDKTGIKAQPHKRPSRDEALKLAKAWIKIAREVEDPNVGAKYGDIRNRIIAMELKTKAASGISAIIDQRGAVCRELSIIGSTLLAEFGIDSVIGSGNVNTNITDNGAHVWIEVLSKDGEIDFILDSNCLRGTVDSFQDYQKHKTINGAKYRDQGPHQRVASVKPRDLFEAAFRSTF